LECGRWKDATVIDEGPRQLLKMSREVDHLAYTLAWSKAVTFGKQDHGSQRARVRWPPGDSLERKTEAPALDAQVRDVLDDP